MRLFNRKSMKINQIILAMVAMVAVSCTQTPAFDPASVADHEGRVSRVEPLSWWVGMQTPLQLLVQGEGWDVRVSMGAGRGEQAAGGESDEAGRPPCQVGWLGIPSPSTRDSCLGLDCGPSSAV